MRALSRRSQDAAQHAAVLEPRLRGFKGDLTVADAAARGGLALRDAEAALVHLVGEYGGHLKATESGELLFSFPHGLTKTDEDGALVRAAKAVGRVVAGVGRFLVRAWVSVVLVGYAVVLAGVLIAWAMKDEGDGLGEALGLVLRIVAEALFWTFHPFSPVVWTAEPAWMRGRRRTRKVPFYEKVNRFVFGPPQEKEDPREVERKLVAELRRLEGRVGPGDVMRIAGGTREQAEALLCRLVLDYDGDIEATDEGAVVYKFPAVLRSADLTVAHARPAAPIWTRREEIPPLTGNPLGTNVMLGMINGFNLAASGYVLANELTFERIGQLMTEGVAPPTGDTPLVLGAIPFAFSATLFALPMGRLIMRSVREKKAARENGRRALLRAVLEGNKEVMDALELKAAWQRASGLAPDESELTAEVRKLGGEPDVTEEGRLVYRFRDLAAERKALTAERRAVSPSERAVGPVIFSSDDPPDPS